LAGDKGFHVKGAFFKGACKIGICEYIFNSLVVLNHINRYLIVQCRC